jgi:hypothetical protein
MVLPAAAIAEEKRSLGGRVNEALDRAAAHLVEKQNEDGFWRKDDKVHPLGRTALCTFALLHAGYLEDHPSVRKALRFLNLHDPQYFTELEPHSTYEAGCLLLLMNALGKEYGEQIHRLCDWLVGHFDKGPGLWGYPEGWTRDLSNTQYAAFGLKVGELHGYKVPPRLWKALIRGVLSLQAPGGGFRYRGGTLYSGSMTHAGLLILLFATQGLHMKVLPGDLREAMRRGHDWAEKNYSVKARPMGKGYGKAHYYYYMYGLERYAQFFGFKTIAGHDWYTEGAEELLRRQEDNGGWGRLEETCFAILFLRKVTLTAPRARKVGKPKEKKKSKKPAETEPDKSVPYLREWLLAGPYPSKRGEDEMLFDKHFKISKAAPAPGKRAGKKKWIAYAGPADEIDLQKACAEAVWCVYYAALYLFADQQTEAALWLGTDDGFRLYLNGERILESHHHNFQERRVPVTLKAGRNLVIVKIENTTYYCKLKARLTDLQGKPQRLVRASNRRRLKD